MRLANLSAPPDDSPPKGAAPAAPPLPLALPGACSYCLGADTPVLMANGSTRPIADLRAGDAVYGTASIGTSRRYVTTTVVDHWSTAEPAYRVSLQDGTRLMVGGDHRFLTRRGWRHVGAVPGTDQPHLVPGDVLYGMGRFAEPPKDTPDYRAGFLCGLVRGDATHHLPTNPLAANPRPTDRTTGPRLDWARTSRPSPDRSAWDRADTYLQDLPLQEALRWPERPTDLWRRGFLAGAFSAIGNTDGLGVRFASRDRSYLSRVTEALRHLAVPSRESASERTGALPTVEIGGRLWEALRFRHATAADSPLEAAGKSVESDGQLAVADIEPLGLVLPLYDITTGTGDFIADGIVSHNCRSDMWARR